MIARSACGRPLSGAAGADKALTSCCAEIRIGDLLTSSTTSGHAMRADLPAPGTVIAKALEPLATGTGEILVLVMPR